MQPTRHHLRTALTTAVVISLATLTACSDDSGTDGTSTDAAATSPTPGDTTEGGPTAPLPSDPCAPVTAALGAVGWTVGDAMVENGAGGPGTQCTFDGTDGDGNFANGWVMWLESTDLEYHEDEAIDGVGATAWRGSPQSGELLVDAAPPFRLWVTTGDEAAVAIAHALVTG